MHFLTARVTAKSATMCCCNRCVRLSKTFDCVLWQVRSKLSAKSASSPSIQCASSSCPPRCSQGAGVWMWPVRPTPRFERSRESWIHGFLQLSVTICFRADWVNSDAASTRLSSAMSLSASLLEIYTHISTYLCHVVAVAAVSRAKCGAVEIASELSSTQTHVSGFLHVMDLVPIRWTIPLNCWMVVVPILWVCSRTLFGHISQFFGPNRSKMFRDSVRVFDFQGLSMLCTRLPEIRSRLHVWHVSCGTICDTMSFPQLSSTNKRCANTELSTVSWKMITDTVMVKL